MLAKLQRIKCRATAAACFPTVVEKTFVRREGQIAMSLSIRPTSRAAGKEGREPDRNVLMYLRTGSAGPTPPAARIVGRRRLERPAAPLPTAEEKPGEERTNDDRTGHDSEQKSTRNHVRSNGPRRRGREAVREKHGLRKDLHVVQGARR